MGLRPDFVKSFSGTKVWMQNPCPYHICQSVIIDSFADFDLKGFFHGKIYLVSCDF